ncbi:hypothetical protein [Alicyclobacillus mengziensis]|uniref:Uncharacterized protein n=1 Tax=Alicyclobacillus mengziensis TaxID=2931921 RepID=A0A9X7Z8M2_9BACL|nr:hypothetical protein [Alicyclobacillus mengziensis]QSO48575.1 hypothetical protein JZ786_06220 [Alicyclobacillus mengziensis]
MQTKIGIRLTDGAKQRLTALQAEQPGCLFRIQASPACGVSGGASWTLSAVDTAWDSDTVVTIEGLSFVYSSFLEYLMDDVELDWDDDPAYDGPIFHVNEDNPSACP